MSGGPGMNCVEYQPRPTPRKLCRVVALAGHGGKMFMSSPSPGSPHGESHNVVLQNPETWESSPQTNQAVGLRSRKNSLRGIRAPGINLDPLRDLVSQKTRMTYFKVYDIEPVEDVYTERRLPKKDCQMKDGQMTAVHKWSRAPAATSKSR